VVDREFFPVHAQGAIKDQRFTLEMAAINSRWRGYNAASDGYWRNYHRLIAQIIIGTGLLLLISLAWNGYLQRQIKHRKLAERALNDQWRSPKGSLRRRLAPVPAIPMP
jgi:two-component system sensor histidine kinase EvgS